MAVMVAASLIYMNFIKSNTRQQIFSTLSELSSQNTVILRAEVEKGISDVADMAEIVGGLSLNNKEEVVRILLPFVEQKGLLRMGIADLDGNVVTTDDKEFNIADREYFKDCMRGIAGVSNSLSDKVDGGEIIVFSAPVYIEGNLAYALFETFDAKKYREAISTPTFGGEGFSYVVDKVGNYVISSDPSKTSGNYSNFFEEMEAAVSRNGEALRSLIEGIESHGSGFVVYHQKQSNYLYYEPAGINDWYLFTIIPTNVVNRWANEILFGSYVFIFLCAGMFCSLLAYNMHCRRKGYRKVEQMAYVDPLTGGATYGRFKLDAEELFQTYPNKRYVLLSLDVDNFQAVNEIYGYETGDEVLCYIWKTCCESMREGETTARVFDDHFVALVTYEKDLEELEARFREFADRIKTFHPSQGEGDCNISVSVGVYLVEDRQMSLDAMLNRAKMPQKEQKGTASSVYGVYREEKMAEKLFNKRLENRFDQAVRNREFLVYYQPKYDLTTDEFCGAEALVRWQEPDGGLLMPGSFIPVFEQNGDIARLDEYMLHEVCRSVERWQGEGLHSGPVSVNVSRIQLLKPDFVERYVRIIKSYDIPVSSIQLEFTETMMVENEQVLIDVASKLHRHGILVQMDDFGSGYSSLSMLKNVPIDILKLDKRFVDDLENDEKGEAIVTGAISLAHTLRITVTAEGVENKAQFDFLKKERCDAIQGYYCAKPMEEAKFEELLRNQAGQQE